MFLPPNARTQRVPNRRPMEDLTIDALLGACRGWDLPPPLAVHPPRRARVPGGAGDSVVYYRDTRPKYLMCGHLVRRVH